MSKMSNSSIVTAVKEITIAKLSGSTSPTNAESGNETAAFMQAIYDKIVELEKRTD